MVVAVEVEAVVAAGAEAGDVVVAAGVAAGVVGVEDVAVVADAVEVVGAVEVANDVVHLSIQGGYSTSDTSALLASSVYECSMACMLVGLLVLRACIMANTYISSIECTVAAWRHACTDRIQRCLFGNLSLFLNKATPCDSRVEPAALELPLRQELHVTHTVA